LPQDGEPGRIRLHASHISGRWLEIYRNARLPFAVAIESLALEVAWQQDAAVTASFALDAYAEPEDRPKIHLGAKADLDETGLRIDALNARQAELQLLAVAANLPLTVRIDKENTASLHEALGGVLALQANADLEDQDLLRWIGETF